MAARVWAACAWARAATTAVAGTSLVGAIGGGQRGRVGRLDDHLQVRLGGFIVVQQERVDIAFVGDQVEIAVDAGLGRVQEAVIADRIDDPEVLIAGGDFQDLLGRRQLDQRGVAHLRANTHDVVGVVVDDAGRLLAVGYGCDQAEHQRKDGSAIHLFTSGCVGLG